MKILMRILMPTLLICLPAPAAVVFAQDNPPKSTSAQSGAKKAFEKLKTLAGSWAGKIGDLPVQATIRVTGLGSVIMHDITGHNKPGNHEISMMYLEGDRLLMTHYCDAGNRQRLEGKLSADGNSVEFNFLDVAGGTERGFVKRMVFIIADANNHVGELIYSMPDGKQVQARGVFQRTK
jgi:hypothetical protein